MTGSGAERYVRAWEHIAGSMPESGVNAAIETLHTASQEGSYSTLSSMVFDPVAQDVYLVLKCQFEHIWRASMRTGVTETWSGFQAHGSVPLSDSGVLASSLEELACSLAQHARLTVPVGKLPGVLAAAGLLLALAWIGGLGARRLGRRLLPETRH